MSLRGELAIVTGAGGGIKAIAARLLIDGARMAIADSDGAASGRAGRHRVFSGGSRSISVTGQMVVVDGRPATMRLECRR